MGLLQKGTTPIKLSASHYPLVTISQTSRTPRSRYPDYQYRIVRHSSARHAWWSFPPCSAPNCREHPCRNRWLHSVSRGQGLSSDKYRTEEPPSGSSAAEASLPCSAPCSVRPSQLPPYAAASRWKAARGT